MAKRGRPVQEHRTESTRVFLDSAKVLQEIARLERVSLALVVERYLNKEAMRRDLAAAEKKELDRLTACVAK